MPADTTNLFILPTIIIFFSDWLEQDVLAGLQGAVNTMHSQIVDHDDDDGIMMMRG